MGKKGLISKRIEFFYERASEETRLEKGMGTFEFERVKALIDRYLKTESATIIDVGGGTGKYAEWLSEMGHQVFLVDPVPGHITLARKRASVLKNKFHVRLGEARDLEFPKNFADMVILHGPLYHLQSRRDREKAIGEAKRIIKKGGIVLGFVISYTASTLAGLMQGLIHQRQFYEMCKEELTTGQHNPPEEYPWLLAEAYYHRPQELIGEFTGQRLTVLDVHAVEGIAWLDRDFFTSLADETARNTLEDLIRCTENDLELMAFSPHMMIASRKE